MITIPIMAFLGRLCGASWTPSWLPAKLLWALAIGALTYTNAHLFLIVVAWSFVAMQLGHGRFYGMQGANLADPNPEDIEQYVQKVYKGDITKPIYSWLCMGTKGFLIGLPVGIIPALANAIWWPFSYYVGMRVIKDGAYAEVLAGAGLGLIIWLSL